MALTRELNRSFAGSDLPLHRRLVAGDLPATLVTTMALRIRRYDRYVAEFLSREPDGVVVNLGAGWTIDAGTSTTAWFAGSTWTCLR